MSLLGFLLCGLGIGYAFHKDNQKFANIRKNAINELGRGVYEPLDTRSMANKHYREVKRYFDERYNYYINNLDYMYDNTDLEFIIEHRAPWQNFKKKEDMEQLCAGQLAREDVINKYAPSYLKREGCCDLQLYKISSYELLSNIARALTRVEMYKMGFKPSHMNTMQSPLYGDRLYHLNAMDMTDDQPSECNYDKLVAEGRLKHNLIGYNEEVSFDRKVGK